MKAIISGGGTGGHIFPAIAIANALKRRHPECQILFVGAEGRMEMEKVPAAGYDIKGLPIAGLQRKLSLSNIIKNLQLPFKILRSRSMVKGILQDFQPDIVVGVGGFASEPTLKTASKMGFPTLLQEQNSYAGLTNKMLAGAARTICVAYDGMERFFPKEKIVFTGNPIRENIEHIYDNEVPRRFEGKLSDIKNLRQDHSALRTESIRLFELDPEKKTVLSVGGSLGAGSINKMISDNLTFFKDNDIQIIWQTGKGMYDDAVAKVQAMGVDSWVKVHQFINQMDKAYRAADVIISRAGAIAISELCIVAKPVILIPSPNVAEDHQTKNAMALVDKGAAIMVRDAECHDNGLEVLRKLLDNKEQQSSMSKNIGSMGRRRAADKIVDEIDKIVKK
ncbi:MAG: undecaprenyldiphospho-muramoylpentapeptide beta-N-acetylglucosaminyltransferase [Bacteroidales bacterium]|nr:undecaprenyldiphospho-muramoylpentapeptide beta-N-acetylglucosaminyltransferase [Bacteroidales bacterium]